MRVRLLILPCLLTAAAVGCADRDGGFVVEASAGAIASAGQATIDADTARMVTTMTMDVGGLVPGFDQPIELTAEGEVDFANDRSVLELDLGAMFEQFAGPESGGGEAGGLGELFGEPMRMIQDGTVQYQCGPMYRLAAGAECVRIDLADLPGFDAARFGTPSPADPGALLESLQGTGAVEEVGDEDVDGVPTTHFRGTFTLADAMADLPADASEEIEAAYERLGLDGGLDDEQRFDVWIDEDGRVRQLRQHLALGGEDGLTTSVEVRFVEFGIDVDLDLPTDVVDYEDVFGPLG
jgi:hypothetical protein